MRKLGLTLSVLAFVACSGIAQSYRKPVFVTGGAQNNGMTGHAAGLWLMDGAKRTVSSLFPPALRHGSIRSAVMDWDNRCLVCAIGGYPSPTSGIPDGLYHYDPALGRMTTILPGNYGKIGFAYRFEQVMLDQNGDYVFETMTCQATTPSTLVGTSLFRYGASSGLTTVFSTVRDLGEYARLTYAMGQNIASGNYLIQTRARSVTTAHNWSYGVLEIDIHNPGKWTTFSNGGGYYIPNTTTYGYGWLQSAGRLWQDYASDALVMVDDARALMGLYPGQTPRTTLAVVPDLQNWRNTPGTFGFPDLQSAYPPRFLIPASFYANNAQTAGYWTYDPRTYVRVAIACDPNNTVGQTWGPTSSFNIFMPYRGRHIASTRVRPNIWDLHFSAPDYPNKAYVAGVGVSGVRPAVRLLDRRRIWLKPDQITAMSISGQLRPLFDPGPLILDSNGEAKGRLDVSTLPRLGGQPIWIALLVIDPKAPGGIAFIPDTYVIRIP